MPSRSILLAGVAATLMISAQVSAEETEAASPKTQETDRQEASSTTCLRETGTRIKLRSGQCATASGRVYSTDDLRSTGQPTVGDALRQLDPNIGSSLGR
ncbi:MAG: hypothetical protein C0434_14190 [Xanthomonadaceae bacterium]|nr:hypothetical protein [Xanthomonadaceae bacterium]